MVTPKTGRQKTERQFTPKGNAMHRAGLNQENNPMHNNRVWQKA
jgi:hypothetical protein